MTLPFITNSFDSHTNNGSLRFGLFDYYDGGLRPTADATTLTGSGGQGASVRGYMLSVDFGTNFTANTPLSLLVRTGLDDSNLMGTTADYSSMASGPPGGGYANAPSFVAGTPYTLEFSVSSGGNQFGDGDGVDLRAAGRTGPVRPSTPIGPIIGSMSFAIRPHSLEASADSFTVPEFKVELSPLVPPPCTNCFPILRISDWWYLSPTQFALVWESFQRRQLPGAIAPDAPRALDHERYRCGHRAGDELHQHPACRHAELLSDHGSVAARAITGLESL